MNKQIFAIVFLVLVLAIGIAFASDMYYLAELAKELGLMGFGG